MSRIAWKKTQRIARIPARSDEAVGVLILDEEGLPITDEECPERKLYTEESDA